MLKGFMLPRSPLGQAPIDPPPPWHYSGDVVAVEFWADPAVTAAFLPQGLSADPKTNGHANELTVSITDDLKLVDMWRGEGQLSFPKASGEELHTLGPIEVGAGFRYGLSYSVTDLEIVKDFTK